jgi:hypothetical protein
MGMSLPLSSRPPGPTAMTLPSCGFSFSGIRNDDAAGGVSLGIDSLDDNAVVKRSEFQRFLATVADVVRFSIGGITQKGTYVLLLEISSSKLKKVSVRENLATLP